jgi:LEA14-like dessication related protein
MKIAQMKKIANGILVLIVSCIFSFSLYSESGPTATIEWKNTTMDFGQIAQNKPIVVKFEFQNPGMVPLVITSVKPSCGCTVADYPKQPIPSGGEGTVSVTFDAKSSGHFSKSIAVHTNTSEKITNLFIKGEVVK